MIGVVVIGRNEGERLLRCFETLTSDVALVVYVDSGSTDGSVAAARARGVEVVELDMTQPFTAARARNAGLERLVALRPDLTLVQMIDGDCALVPGWLETAERFLAAHPEVAVVCGRRRERFPEASLYNAVIDREWDTPTGEARACGGDALMRIDALRAIGGYNPGLIAGEEPEMCVRLRAEGWKIWRLPAEMTWHDAALTCFSQWWRRAQRAGHAYAEGVALHGRAPEHHKLREMLRALFWGLALPLCAILGTALTPWSLALLLAWPVQVLRIRRRGADFRQAVLMMLAKLPEAQGILQYALTRSSGRPRQLIEYK